MREREGDTEDRERYREDKERYREDRERYREDREKESVCAPAYTACIDWFFRSTLKKVCFLIYLRRQRTINHSIF